jgi:hypothetical protein
MSVQRYAQVYCVYCDLCDCKGPRARDELAVLAVARQRGWRSIQLLRNQWRSVPDVRGR